MSTAKRPPVVRKGYFPPAYLRFFSDPLSFSLEQSARYGPLFEVPVPFRKVIIVTGQEEMRQILQSGHRNYVKSPFYNAMKLALGEGLLTSEGTLWKQQRKLMQPVFYKSSLEGLFGAMRSEASVYLESLHERVANGPVSLDLSLEMMRVTANIVLRTLFSTDSTLDRKEMYRIMISMQEYVMGRALRPHLLLWFILNGTHWQFKRDIRKIDASLYQMIDARQQEENPPHDLLSLLTHARDADTGERMDRKLVRDELLTLFAAGHETSANALTWTLWLLGHHPEALQKLRDEERTVLNGRLAGLEDLPRLTYTRQVIDEGMRLFPPAYAVGRQAVSDDVIGGYQIPKNAILFLSIYSLHRDEKVWKDASAFRPERFADAKAIPADAYMPFGLGPRKCIGFQFALMEMQMLLPALVRQFDFQFPAESPGKQALITLRPKGGMKAVVKVRSV